MSIRPRRVSTYSQDGCWIFDCAEDWRLLALGKSGGDLGGKVRAVWAVLRVPGSFAALRMTATTKARTSNGKGRSRSPSGMTTKKSNGKGRSRSPSGMTTKKSNGKNNEQQNQTAALLALA